MALYRFQLRRDTTANWNSANPILARGEPGFDYQKNLLKIGDGVTAWNSLPGSGANQYVKLSNQAGILYGTDGAGAQTAFLYSTTAANDTIALRTADGRLRGQSAVDPTDLVPLKDLTTPSSAVDAVFEKMRTKVDLYTSGTNVTWTKPAGARFIEIEVRAGGGGGGSGRRGASATVRTGGGGGGAGGRAVAGFLASDLPATLQLTVGSGGAGGAAVTSNDTSGNIGSSGNDTYVARTGTPSGSNAFMAAGGGGGGTIGSASASQVSAGGAGLTGTGGSGGASGTVGGGASGAGIQGGGGGGGGVDASNVVILGGEAYALSTNLVGTMRMTRTNSSAGTAGASPTVGTIWTAGGIAIGGVGGNGGSSGAGGAGGAGLNGGGGGGGAGAINGFNSGAGGAGGNGYVRIITHF